MPTINKITLNQFSLEFNLNRKTVARLIRKDYLKIEQIKSRTYIDLDAFIQSVNDYNSKRPLDASLTPEGWLQEANRIRPPQHNTPGKRGGWNKGKRLLPLAERQHRHQLDRQLEEGYESMHDTPEVLTPLETAYSDYYNASLYKDTTKEECDCLQLQYYALYYHNKPLTELTTDELSDILERQRITQLPVKEWAKYMTDKYGSEPIGKDVLSLHDTAML
jgi:hypothetical protein